MKIKTQTLVTLKNGNSRWYNGKLKQETLKAMQDRLGALTAHTYKIDTYAPSRGLFDKQKIYG